MNTRPTFQFLRFALGLVLFCGLALGDVSPASAAVQCYVKWDAGGIGTGTSWVDAFTDLQLALGASSCTEVWVARGTYRPTSGTNRTVYFVLKSGVSIYGGFAGTETLLTERNPAANPTILSGEIGAVGNSDNSYHVVYGGGANSTALLDGFTITAGYAPDNGGGMYNFGSSPRLANVTFSGNSATKGGGMYNYWFGSPSLTNVTFSGNSATYGGGMFNDYHSSPSLTNVTFSGNSATLAGGAMYNYDNSSPSLTNVTFSSNTVYNGPGGGISNDYSSPTIINSILYGDSGGEIANYASSAVVTYSIVQGGYAGTGNLDANPLLGPLQDNGGFTQTRALGYGSPAIDTGTNAGCPPKDQRGIARPQGPLCDMGAYEFEQGATTIVYSTGSQDGWILESTETSSLGGTMNATATTFNLGDDALDKQYRTILSFNTAGLPDNTVITKVTLKIKRQGIIGTNPFNTHSGLKVDIRKPYFGPAAGLAISDFQAAASKSAVATFNKTPAMGAWYSAVLSSAAYPYINRAGLTQFRLRFAKGDNDDLGADYLKFYSGNAGAAYRPVLVIEYYLP